MKPKRSHKLDKLAKLYDGDILPIWSLRFGRLLLRDLQLPPKANVLDVGCGTGYPALELIKRMDEQGRIIAIDPSSPMLDVAREKAGPLSGKRIFFRSESAEPRLPFTDDVYDLVIANLTLHELEFPAQALRDFARVTKPGGKVAVSLPLAGTFAEFYDLFREVLIKRDRLESLEQLDAYLAAKPSQEMLEAWMHGAGLVDVAVEEERYTLWFKSAREFFFAPLVDMGELADWKRIAGRGPEMQDVFWHVKEAIDSYFGDKGFGVAVVVGAARGRKPTEAEAALGAPTPVAVAAVHDEVQDVTTGQIVIGTGEFEVVSGEADEEEDDDTDVLA